MQKYKDELKIKKRKKLFFRLILFCIAGIISLIGLAYLLFFTRFLDVRTVIIETPEGLRANINSVVDDWLSYGFWKFTRRNNILFFYRNKLSSQLAGQFPKLESIKVSKKLPHSLIISGNERKPIGVWCLKDNEQCFYFDKNGIVFSEAQPSTGFLILNVADQRLLKLKLGDEVVAQDWLSNIIKANELLVKVDINISEFIIPADSFNEFHAKTAEGWEIMFNIQTDIEKQISALAIFLKEKLLPTQRTNLQYVDLRIQDRIYYK